MLYTGMQVQFPSSVQDLGKCQPEKKDTHYMYILTNISLRNDFVSQCTSDVFHIFFDLNVVVYMHFVVLGTLKTILSHSFFLILLHCQSF